MNPNDDYLEKAKEFALNELKRLESNSAGEVFVIPNAYNKHDILEKDYTNVTPNYDYIKNVYTNVSQN